MKFRDFKYEHLDYETLAKTYQDLLEPLKKAQNVDDFMTSFKAINRFRGHIQTMMSLVNVRHTIDTSDPYYDAENNYWDETSPRLQVFEDEFFATALACPFREKLPIPATFFKLLENARKSFDPQIIEELQEENRLATAYGKLKASAKIAFRGQIYNLASINTFINDADRNVRKEAYDAMMTFYNEHEDEFDEIFDQMVKVRDRMARKLGYENFIDLAYLRMNRLDYDQKMVEDYRRQIVEYMVPVANDLYQRQAKRIGVSKLMAYDAGFEFKSGNPKPQGNKDELLNKALKMYSEMSKESGEYFKMMCDMELFDLETRPHKEMGGYCTDFYDYKVPFIFANFNGTQGDVDVLTHEAGHGFQVYLAMQTLDIPDISFPTYESCEIHSMSMEFFAHPWMELFFGEDAEKYKFYHVASALTFVPYGCLVDHFQHEVYAHPKMSKAERKETFRRLEKIYKPHLDYSGYPLLERGGFFYRQGHIFQNPFYYIDYTLAQVCALQFFKRTLENDPHAWEDYVHLCRLGGSKSFLELVEEAGLKSPFAEGTIAEVVEAMVKVLNIDDAKL